MHQSPHPMAGKTMRVKATTTHPQVSDFGGSEFRVEDWWDRAAGKSWMYCNGNPACLIYAIRTGTSEPPIPTDDEVVYGKVGSYGHLVHVSELEMLEGGAA